VSDLLNTFRSFVFTLNAESMLKRLVRPALNLLSRAALCVLLLACMAAPRLHAATLAATPGSDGNPGTITGIVNTYYPGTSANASGANAITLGVSRGATTPIEAGDLLLIMQMQDAVVNANNTSAYGANNGSGSGATSLGQSGLYEYIVATSDVPVGGGSLTFLAAGTGGALLNSYFNANATTTQGQRRYQVVRVPQYSTVTINSGLTAAAWNGNTGGILAIDCASLLDFPNNTTVSVTGLGFRGGAARQLSGVGNTAGYADTDYRNVAPPPTGTTGVHASKGEGIAGAPRYVYSGGAIADTGVEGYPNGSYARGAPGNAGGGGSDGNVAANDENSGGGGGSNGSTGGKGGNSWNSNEAYGGIAGTLFPATPARLTFGGGGGAGTRNNSSGVMSSGAPGGGMILIQTDTNQTATNRVLTLNADGEAGVDAENDGAGGGGGGGTIVFYSTSNMNRIIVTARGGAGGKSWPTEAAGGTPGNRHGPGGGGGGGVAFISDTTPRSGSSVASGASGTTTTSNDPYGATNGGTDGPGYQSISSSQIPGAVGANSATPNPVVTKTTSTPYITLNGSANVATYTINVANGAGGGVRDVIITDTLPGAFKYASTTSIVLSGGAKRTSTTNPTANSAAPVWGTFRIPSNASVAITFNVSIPSTQAAGTYQNPVSITYLDPKRSINTATLSASYNSASSTAEDVTLAAPFSVSQYETVDSDGDGLLDAIRVIAPAGVALSDDFSGFTATVAGYTVTGYATDLFAGIGLNDNVFYIKLTEKTYPAGTGDTGARPVVTITANTTLTDNIRPGLRLATGSATPLDRAQPVLLVADWMDASGGGVSAPDDQIILRMSETVTVLNATIGDVRLPVINDTLSTSVINNQSGATITINFLGTPVLTPGGTYNSGQLVAGSPSGIYIYNGVHITDASGNTALNQTVPTAVDISPGTTLLRITWDDLSTTPKVWNVPASDFGEAHLAQPTTGPLIVRNSGNVRVNMSIACDAASTPSNWALASVAGTSAFEMKCDSAPLDGVFESDFSSGAISLGSAMYSGVQKQFNLRFVYPTSLPENNLGVLQTINITITATQN
jgi:hypothetical protein